MEAQAITRSSDVLRTRAVVNGAGGGLSDVTLRVGKMDDASTLTTFINNVFIKWKADSGGDRVTTDGKQVARLLQEPSSAFLIAEKLDVEGNAQIVGCCHASWSGITDGNDPEVNSHLGVLGVMKENSRRGIGKLLVASAEQLCRRQLGQKDMVMEISVHDIETDLCKWYERQGYKKGKLIQYPRPEEIGEGVDVTMQIMKKTIPYTSLGEGPTFRLCF